MTALIDRLAEARDDDAVLDFSECIDAADSGRIRASIALQEYFLRKHKEAAHASAAVTSRINAPADSVQAVVPLAGAQKVYSSEAKLGIVDATKADSPTELTPPKRTKTFPSIFRLHSRIGSHRSSLSTASTLLESPPLSGGQPVFTDRPNGNAAYKAGAQAPSKSIPYNNRLSGTSYASSKTGHTSATSAQSPKSSTSRRTSLSSEARSTIFQTDVAPITKYGGCCKSAYLLREGKQGKALRRKEISSYGPVDKPRSFVWACSTNGCEFEVPAIKNAKDRIIFDDTIRQWDGMNYTLNFLAKSHATRKDPSAAIEYRCVFCNLFGFQSLLFNERNELLSHVLTHAGSSLGPVKLEGGIVVSNCGLAVNESFDVDFPIIQGRELAQRSNSIHSNKERAVAALSERTSPTPWSDEIDVEKSHWAGEGVR